MTNCTDVTDGKVYGVIVEGLGGYTNSKVTTLDNAWGIDKKDIKDCDVKVTDGVVTVMNGYIPVRLQNTHLKITAMEHIQ